MIVDDSWLSTIDFRVCLSCKYVIRFSMFLLHRGELIFLKIRYPWLIVVVIKCLHFYTGLNILYQLEVCIFIARRRLIGFVDWSSGVVWTNWQIRVRILSRPSFLLFWNLLLRFCLFDHLFLLLFCYRNWRLDLIHSWMCKIAIIYIYRFLRTGKKIAIV